MVVGEWCFDALLGRYFQFVNKMLRRRAKNKVRTNKTKQQQVIYVCMCMCEQGAEQQSAIGNEVRPHKQNPRWI